MSHAPERSPNHQLAEPAPTPAADACRALAVADSSFDSLETQFFSDGDALNVAPELSAESWDEPTVICDRRHRRRRRPVRWIAVSAGAGMLCAGLFLWYAHGHARTRTTVAMTAASAPVAAVPAPVPSPASAPVPSPAAALPLPIPASPAPAASPSPQPLSPVQEAAGADLTGSRSLAACEQAYQRRRGKDVLTDCGRAFADNPDSATIATILAKTELDRGRSRQALDWAKKALAIDEKHADAYVFLGGAEQAVGHAAAAKAAYRRYLQLSPRGRYAADLRAVLTSL